MNEKSVKVYMTQRYHHKNIEKGKSMKNVGNHAMHIGSLLDSSP
jgi:hypothetical protein